MRDSRPKIHHPRSRLISTASSTAEVKTVGGADIAQQAIVGPAAVGTDEPLSEPPTVAQVVDQGFHAPGKPRQRAPEAFVNEQVDDRYRGEAKPGIRPQPRNHPQTEGGQIAERPHAGRPERRRQHQAVEEQENGQNPNGLMGGLRQADEQQATKKDPIFPGQLDRGQRQRLADGPWTDLEPLAIIALIERVKREGSVEPIEARCMK